MKITAETIAQARAALEKAGLPLDVLKADTLSVGGLSPTPTQGLVAYDLSGPSKKLYPILTPLRNRIARVEGVGTAHNWRSVTAIDTAQVYPGLPEGARAQPIAVTVNSPSRPFVTVGKEGTVTFEQQSAGRTFEDARALNAIVVMQAAMQDEEQLIVGGNATLALGTTPTPSLSAGGSGSTLTNVAHTVRCVALTHPAWLRSRVVNGRGVPMTMTHTDPVTGTTTNFGGGSAKISAAATVTPTAGQNITASVVAVRGAVAYAWFIGTADGASCRLAAITTIAQAVLSAVPAAITPGTGYGATAADFTTNNTDNSANALTYDGALSIAADATSGAYFKALANGSGLTADSAAGIGEWDECLQYLWDNARLGPQKVLVSGQDVKRATQKVVGGGGSPLFRFVVDRNGDGVDPRNLTITAGTKLGDYLNKFTGQLIPVEVHPNMPSGSQLFWTNSLPYPLNETPNVFEMVCRRDYYEIEWTPRTRRYEHGVYAEEVLCNYASFALGLIQNVADV